MIKFSIKMHDFCPPNNFSIFILQAYLEFFTSKDNIDILLAVLKDYPQVNYHVVDKEV